MQFRRFSVAAQNRLRNYPWPDNVRELKNLVHRLLIQAARRRSGWRRSSGSWPCRRLPGSRWSSRTFWRCRCARPANSSNA
ncbi:AAA-type ATPase lid domain-containing protein, partial [Klebsiella pneumoniae]